MFEQLCKLAGEEFLFVYYPSKCAEARVRPFLPGALVV
jgi:hypothetical protein